MNLRIIDASAGIVSSSYTEIREDCREPETVIFFYHSRRDLIILNEDHPDFNLWRDLLQGYINLDDRKKEIFREAIRGKFKHSDRILDCLSVADRICRIRRLKKAVTV